MALNQVIFLATLLRWHLGIPLQEDSFSSLEWEITGDSDFSLQFITSVFISGSLSSIADITVDINNVRGVYDFEPGYKIVVPNLIISGVGTNSSDSLDIGKIDLFPKLIYRLASYGCYTFWSRRAYPSCNCSSCSCTGNQEVRLF